MESPRSVSSREHLEQGAATSSSKGDLVGRLKDLYQGMLKKGCVRQYVQLSEQSGCLVPTARTSWTTAMPPAGISCASSPGTDPHGTVPTSRSFRSYESAEVEDERKIPLTDPRSGLEMPAELVDGKSVAFVECMACRLPMELRRQRDGAG